MEIERIKPEADNPNIAFRVRRGAAADVRMIFHGPSTIERYSQTDQATIASAIAAGIERTVEGNMVVHDSQVEQVAKSLGLRALH